MASLNGWRTIIAETLAAQLGPAGAPVNAYRFPTPTVDPPAVVVVQGGPAAYIETDSALPGVAVDLRMIRWTLLLVTGRVGEEATFDLLDAWIDRLEPALAACAGHDLNDLGQYPDLESVGRPRKVVYDTGELVGTVAFVALPIPIT